LVSGAVLTTTAFFVVVVVVGGYTGVALLLSQFKFYNGGCLSIAVLCLCSVVVAFFLFSSTVCLPFWILVSWFVFRSVEICRDQFFQFCIRGAREVGKADFTG
jgi:hypothetical protein